MHTGRSESLFITAEFWKGRRPSNLSTFDSYRFLAACKTYLHLKKRYLKLQNSLQNTPQSNTSFPPSNLIRKSWQLYLLEVINYGDTWSGYQDKKVEEIKGSRWDMNIQHYILDAINQKTIAGRRQHLTSNCFWFQRLACSGRMFNCESGCVGSFPTVSQSLDKQLWNSSSTSKMEVLIPNIT